MQDPLRPAIVHLRKTPSPVPTKFEFCHMRKIYSLDDLNPKELRVKERHCFEALFHDVSGNIFTMQLKI